MILWVKKMINYGTDLVGINAHEKLGSTSIKILGTNYDKKKYKDDIRENKTKKFVIVIRDVFSRWKSGYLQDIQYAFTENPLSFAEYWREHGVYHPNPKFIYQLQKEKIDSFSYDSVVFKSDPHSFAHGMDTLTKIHMVDKNLDWICNGTHSKFYIWTQEQEHISDLLNLENVYFVDLKNLSGEAFHKWLCEIDDTFTEIKIGHSNNRISHSLINRNIDLFWKEFFEGKLPHKLNDIDKMTIPFYNDLIPDWYDKSNLRVFEPYHELCKSTQSTIDYIRSNHERYIG
jgi:hypothetical protein